MIREPAVAGQFYPAETTALVRDLDRLVERKRGAADARAVLVPHAGYVYSGGVAGAVYSEVRLPRRFILLGPNHTGWGAPLSLYPEGGWRTPLGVAEIDEALTRQLLREDSNLTLDRAAHTHEHALEVQVPFLQALAGPVRFAAVVVGSRDWTALESLGHALARAVRAAGDPVLLICSSDMNHYEAAEVSAEKDRAAIDRVLALDPEGLYRVVEERQITMCGCAPAVAVLVACRDLGSSAGELVRYAHSGEVNGDHRRVVGYAGIVIR